MSWYTLNCERITASDRVMLSVVLITRCTLKRVDFAHHIFTDDKNISLYDGSTDQVCPLIRRRWVTFC